MTSVEHEVDPTQPKQPDKSLGELFSDLSSETTQLLRTQVELAKTELTDEAKKAGRIGGMFGAAAFAGYLAALLLAFAAAWGLAEVMAEGWAFLIVGAVFAVVAYILYQRARDEARKTEFMPKETAKEMKEDVQWARQKLS
jgi:uncharacterized membrane protein YqjE